jgi:AraC family transcriptional regulator of adaptative response/methylated-DNA-[protein]-cysteine methyltransferase
MQNPGAVRAVGTAVGRNPIAFLIPCHRVIRQAGGFGQYRWGAARKKAILGWEAAHWEAAQHYPQTQLAAT